METEFRIQKYFEIENFEQKNIEPRTTTILGCFEQYLEKAGEYAESNIELVVLKLVSRTEPNNENLDIDLDLQNYRTLPLSLQLKIKPDWKQNQVDRSVE